MSTPAPVFVGFVDEQGKLTLDFPAQFKAYARRFKGEEVEISIRKRRTKRSDRQNRALHALLTQWARERGWTVDDLKDVMLGIAFGHVERTMPITGEIVNALAEPHSSDLDVSQFCHLIEEVLRVAAEDDYILMAPDEYRKAKEAAQREQAKREKRERRAA